MGKKGIRLDYGQLYIDGRKEFFLSGDYPYYQDTKENWEKKLTLIKELDIHIITIDIPWVRHSKEINGKIKYFFDGEFNKNSDLIYFMELIKKHNIYCVIKLGSLPDIISSDYKEDLKVWIEQVRTKILDTYSYPKGNIIAIQIGNKDIQKTQKSDGKIEETQQYQEYIDCFCQNYSDLLKKYNLPLIVNRNPLGNEELINTKFWKNNCHTINLTFGYSNWLGNAAESIEEMARLVAISSICQWPNLQDNWGHIWAGEEYKYSITSLYHGIIMLSRGTTGYNIYNICGTQHPEKHLLYCEEAPISNNGKTGQKYIDLANFVKFIKENQVSLLESKSSAKAVLCFSKESMRNLIEFIKMCILNNMDFDVLDLENTCKKQIEKYKTIILCGSRCMSVPSQKVFIELCKYKENVYMVGDMPMYDENSNECGIVQNYFINKGKKDNIIYENPEQVEKLMDYIKEQSDFIVENNEVYTVLRTSHEVKYVFMINRSASDQENICKINGKELRCLIANRGFAIIKMEDNQVKQIYASGRNFTFESHKFNVVPHEDVV